MGHIKDTESNTKANENITSQINHWLQNCRDHVVQMSELSYQFIFTYGTMTVIVILSICIFFMNPYAIEGDHDSDIWSIIINSYMPTTITFVGVVLFSDNFFKKHKFRGVILELLVVSMCLSYIAFVSINDAASPEPYQKSIINFIRCINIFLILPSIVLMPGFMNENNSDGKISH